MLLFFNFSAYYFCSSHNFWYVCDTGMLVAKSFEIPKTFSAKSGGPLTSALLAFAPLHHIIIINKNPKNFFSSENNFFNFPKSGISILKQWCNGNLWKNESNFQLELTAPNFISLIFSLCSSFVSQKWMIYKNHLPDLRFHGFRTMQCLLPAALPVLLPEHFWSSHTLLPAVFSCIYKSFRSKC